MWQMFVGAGIQGWLGNQLAGAQAEIDTKLSAVNAAATNQVKRSRNVESMARNSLARYVQSVNNNRTLDDGGDAFTANVVNGLRNLDTAVNRGVLNDVRVLEEFGAAKASQAAAGAGGQVVDMINSTTALRSSISRELAKQAVDSSTHDTVARSQSIMSQMVGSMDGSLILDQFDQSQAYAQKKVAISDGQAIFNSVLSTALKTGIGNVAEWGAQELAKLPAFMPGTQSSSNPKYSFNPVKFGGI